jgi:nucleoid DNA-binding protein
MENYLLELIRHHNRIIIPDFGAFIVSREKGQTILFNNFLSFNDGLLITHICESEGVDSDQASDQIKSYVKQIKSSLDDSGAFTINGIGTFSRDQEGILRFQQIATAEEIAENEPENSSSKFLDTEDELLDIEPVAPPVIEMLDTFIPPLAEKETSIPPVIPVYTPQPPKAVEIKTETTQITEKPATPKLVEKEVSHKVETNVYIERERKSLFPLWLVLLLIFIFLVLIGAYLFLGNGLETLKEKFQKTPPPVEQIVEPQPEIIAEPEPVPLEPVEPVVVATRQHHIILGSFKQESKAYEFMNSLLTRGVTAASVITHQERFLVSAEWHPSVNRALQRQEELLVELKMESWVLSISVR